MARSELERLLDEGQSLEEQLNWDEAVEHYGRVCERYPDDPRPRNKRGVVLVRLGKRDEAEMWFKDALEVDANFPPALTNIGSLRLEKGKVEEAISWYERALRVDPDYPGALNNLAVAYRKQGRLVQAIPLMKRAGRQTAIREARRGRQRLGCATHAAVLFLCVTAGLGAWAGLAIHG